MNKTFIIIDFQKDFIDGSLPVPNAKDTENVICNYIKNNYKNINDVLFTVDWHSPKHCSFKRNGGIWPTHCIQFSEGSGISNILIDTCMTYDLPFRVFKKGNADEIEEYGAFIYTTFNEKDSIINVRNELNQSQYIYSTDLVVCGLSVDYCVKETIKNLLRLQSFHNEINIEVLKDGVASIDDGSTFNNFINKHNLKTI